MQEGMFFIARKGLYCLLAFKALLGVGSHCCLKAKRPKRAAMATRPK